MNVRAHVYVHGLVQGVSFRSETKFQAERWNVAGWVRNLSDGRVEAIFEGKKENVERLIDICKKGPAGAEVLKVDVFWENFTGEFSEFNILYGY